MVRPEWWFWDIEITPHLEKRMVQRSLDEIELRSMLQSANRFEKDIEYGRFKIKAGLNGREWEIIVEPDFEEKLLVVVTAYSIGF